MAKQLFSNNASSLLAASIDDVETTVQVASGFGALFPSPTGGDYFLLAVENTDGDIEFMRCTARSADLLTVTRGQEGSTAMAFTSGLARVENRMTKESYELFLQREGDFMEGNLDMDGNNVVDAHLTGTGTKILAGEIVGVPIRGAQGDSSNELVVPSGGARPTIGALEILLENDDLTPFVDFTGQAALGDAQNFTAAQAVTPVVLSILTGEVAIDATDSNKFRLALSANAELQNPSAVLVGQDFSILVVQGASFELTYDTKYRWPGDTPPVFADLSANQAMILTFTYDSVTDRYLGSAAQPYDLT